MKNLRGWITWFIATLYVIYSFTLTTAAAVFSPKIKSALDLSAVQATLAVTAFVVGFACMQIPAGYLLDKYRTRYVVTAGILILAIGNLTTSFANNLLVFSAANFVQGIGASFAFVAAGVLIGQWFKPKTFPILFGLTQALACILSGILHYCLAKALDDNTWSELYFALSAVGFILVIVAFSFIRSPTKKIPHSKLSLIAALKKVCIKPQLWLCTIAAATSLGVLLAYASFWYH
nr:MFS transporter [Gammaproteobacteria bacterium]